MSLPTHRVMGVQKGSWAIRMWEGIWKGNQQCQPHDHGYHHPMDPWLTPSSVLCQATQALEDLLETAMEWDLDTWSEAVTCLFLLWLYAWHYPSVVPTLASLPSRQCLRGGAVEEAGWPAWVRGEASLLSDGPSSGSCVPLTWTLLFPGLHLLPCEGEGLL